MNERRSWLGFLLGAAMVITYIAVREWPLLVLGVGLVVIGMLGTQIRSLGIGREGLKLETWKREVVERVQQHVTGTVSSSMPPPRVEAHGTVRNPSSASERAIDAQTPGEFADEVLKLARPEDFWPHIIEARDSFGRRAGGAAKHAEEVALVHTGDQVRFSVRAVDPKGRLLIYRLRLNGRPQEWTDTSELTWTAESPAREYPVRVELAAKDRGPRAEADFDDWVNFRFEIRPPT